MARGMRVGLVVAAGVAAGWLGSVALAQAPAAWMSTPPVNDLPNPYTTVEGWAKLPAGRTWGSTSAVDIDKDGKSVWVAERCGANNCVGCRQGRDVKTTRCSSSTPPATW